MIVAMWWGNSFIMNIEAHSELSLTDQIFEHVVKYWSGINYNDFEGVWDEVSANRVAEVNGFEFYENGS